MILILHLIYALTNGIETGGTNIERVYVRALRSDWVMWRTADIHGATKARTCQAVS
jgi:hypothetical protein